MIMQVVSDMLQFLFDTITASCRVKTKQDGTEGYTDGNTPDDRGKTQSEKSDEQMPEDDPRDASWDIPEELAQRHSLKTPFDQFWRWRWSRQISLDRKPKAKNER